MRKLVDVFRGGESGAADGEMAAGELLSITGEPVVFAAADLVARELAANEVPLLQALFEANPEYFLAINGRPALPNEARIEFEDRPPASMSYTRQWCLGVFAPDCGLLGVCIVVSDLCAKGVWHITLYLLATSLHGRGIARALYEALEAWAQASGARWLRLGAVVGNRRAERFWRRCGFREVRQRHAVDTGGRVNDLYVMVKPLDEAPWSDYFASVPRDHPDSTLP